MFDEEIALSICKDCIKKLKKKNDQYGDSFRKTIERWGDVGFITRLTDKLGRLEKIVEDGMLGFDVDIKKYESDLKDIFGYIVLRLEIGITPEHIKWHRKKDYNGK